MSVISLLKNPLTHTVRIKSKFFYQGPRIPCILTMTACLCDFNHCCPFIYQSSEISIWFCLRVCVPVGLSLVASLLTSELLQHYLPVLPEPPLPPVILNLTHYLLLFCNNTYHFIVLFLSLSILERSFWGVPSYLFFTDCQIPIVQPWYCVSLNMCVFGHWSRDQTWVSCIGRWFYPLSHWGSPSLNIANQNIF